MASANLYAHPKAFPPMPAVARILSRFDRPELEGFISVAIGLLDVLDGYADLEANGDEEDSTLAEDEAGAELHARIEGGPGCVIGDPPEEDSEDCDGFENEPLFDRRQCKRLNRMHGYGSGCAIGDPDHGAEELGEPEEGIIPPAGVYGIDQTKWNFT